MEQCNKKYRIGRLLRLIVLLLVCGLAYASFFKIFGFGIPCMFHSVTGLDCPACGVTRMSVSLLTLDFKAAFHYNAGLLIASPFLAIEALIMALRYIKNGSLMPSKAENVYIIFIIVFLLIWGVYRNVVLI